mmetsp:Transcript_20453/g.54819  ORF Transcript_20453/g.54819 Transcript_20453/m.54819 type:complete len:265 (-) Transcript_20453:146-940(-)
MIRAALHSCEAFRFVLIETSLYFPRSAVGLASRRVVELWIVTESFLLHVLGLRLVEMATFFGLIREDRNVVPWRWVPVRIVVPFFWALHAMSLSRHYVAVWILPRGCGAERVHHILVGGVQAPIPLSQSAVKIVVERFVFAQLQVRGRSLVWRFDLSSRCVLFATPVPVTQVGVVTLAHVLQDNLANHVWVPQPATVRGGPFNVELRTLIKVHHTFHSSWHIGVVRKRPILANGITFVANLIARLWAIARVEQTMVIVHRVTLF